MITWIYEGILKVCKFADDHQKAFNFSLGSFIGVCSSVADYWRHWTQPEIQYHFWDSIIGGVSNMLVCAIGLHILHKILKPKKKDEAHRDSNKPA